MDLNLYLTIAVGDSDLHQIHSKCVAQERIPQIKYFILILPASSDSPGNKVVSHLGIAFKRAESRASWTATSEPAI